MLYVQLDTNWPDNHKIIEAGIEGAGLHAITMCIAKRQETDGWVHRRVLHRQGASDELIDRLVTLALLDADDGKVRPHDWLDRNPSQAAIEARRATKSEGGKAGNHARWQHPGPLASCPKCNPDEQVIAGSDPTGVASPSACDPKPSPYTESEVATAIPGATVLLPPEQVDANISFIHAVRSEVFNPNPAAGADADRPVAVSSEAQAAGGQS